jgi:hypothetical protein
MKNDAGQRRASPEANGDRYGVIRSNDWRFFNELKKALKG